MRLAIDQRAVELHAGRAFDVGHGSTRHHGMIKFVGVNHVKIIRREMLLNNGHLRSTRRKPGLVLLRSEPAMIIRRILVVHLAYQFVESGFVMLLEPERDGNLLGLIFSAKNLRSSDAA